MITIEYFAGLFDGEGSISLQIRNNCPKIEVNIHMSEPALDVLREINAQYGGKLYSQNRLYNNRNYNMYAVRWANINEIDYVLNILIPHLIIKKEQARLAVWWVNNCIHKRQNLPWGINNARKIVIDKMKLMKRNPLIKADDVVNDILKCFGYTYARTLKVVP